MALIGEEIREVIVEPLELPVPAKPQEEKAPSEPAKEPVYVPA